MNRRFTHLLVISSIVGTISFRGVAADVPESDFEALKSRLAEIERRNEALQSRVADLEKEESESWLTGERAKEVRSIVEEVLADAKKHEQPDHPLVGYNNGFFIQSPDNDFKLTVGGLIQVRYEYALHQADDAAFKTPPLAQGDQENASGFDIRRARVNFTGYAFSPQLFYRFEGDFYGSSTGAFTVTDAYAGYAFSDHVKVRAGAFKTPFTKAEQENDANLQLERSEVNFPFDPQRSLGVSVFGDVVPNRFAYELNANDGGQEQYSPVCRHQQQRHDHHLHQHTILQPRQPPLLLWTPSIRERRRNQGILRRRGSRFAERHAAVHLDDWRRRRI